MKKFNLEEALAGKPVKTRDGRKVLGIYYFQNLENFKYPLAVMIEEKDMENCSELESYTKKGKYILESEDEECNYDLFMDTEKKTMWLAYGDINKTGEYDTTALFPSKEGLEDSYAKEQGWKIIPVEIEV